ncbi:ATP-binding cassette domain-containing protein [Pelistega sp. MC2]|uniref:ABC transporter ATP-binding protein n=1 Tax=Pelistega sp. MC2 TaxID=1720297 RepID=UPI0009F741D7|nr:ATP-binding cassette domain-containing protein [Pelistega sp. MC2]
MSMSECLLQIDHLSRIDSQTGRVFFKDFSCTVHAGDKILVDGVSGSGKSVFLRALALLDPIEQGKIYLENTLITPKNASFYRSQVLYISQMPVVEGETVRDMLELPWGLSIRKKSTFPEKNLQTYLQALQKTPDFLTQSTKLLSGGEKQLCQLLRALLINPKILLLDEPTSALDAEKVTLVEALLEQWLSMNEQPKAWFWISHDNAQKARVAERRLLVHDQLIEEVGRYELS